MIQLSLNDCSLQNRNIYIKEYEKECFGALFPGNNPSDPSISVKIECFRYF